MMEPTVYMSSTYEDLREHRETVYRALRGLPIDLRAMEDYVARDQRPLQRCVQDVAACAVYLGFFAWRYGYIPPRNNAKKKSITELEFRAAKDAERLIFLAREDHPWPPKYIDALSESADSAKKLKALREQLSEEFVCGFFSTPDNLAALATVAVTMAISSAKSTEFCLPEDLTDVAVIRKFGSTLTPEIVAKVTEALHASAGARIVEVDIGTGKTWWSIRLFLLAALAEDFTEIESLMFVDDRGRLLGMSSPSRVRRALEFVDPRLGDAYRTSYPAAGREQGDRVQLVVDTAQRFREHWAGKESGVKVWINARRLRSLLGRDLNTAHVGVDPKRQSDTAALMARVIEQGADLVPVTVKGVPKRVMDRVALATNIASSGLEHFM